MGSYKSKLDLLYLVIIVLQLIGMFVMDFLPLYPAFLWKDPSAPLHFIYTFNRFIVQVSGDPFARSPSSYTWFEATTYVELVSQFPLAIYLIYKMLQKRPIDGQAELAGLAFGCLNFMGSAICTFELWHMLPATFAPGHQNKLIFTEFGPYAVISGVMAVDMYMRLLKRVQEPGKAKAL